MNVSTITMDPAEAQQKLDGYRNALESRHSAKVEKEWQAAADAYKELAKGTPLIDPLAAIRECGWRSDSRPVLAIARADMARVKWNMPRNSKWWDSDAKLYKGAWSPMQWQFAALRNNESNWRRRDGAGKTFTIPDITTEPPGNPADGTAMVPMVPPDVLPGAWLRSQQALHPVGSRKLGCFPARGPDPPAAYRRRSLRRGGAVGSDRDRADHHCWNPKGIRTCNSN
jgi:hypothetical protein